MWFAQKTQNAIERYIPNYQTGTLCPPRHERITVAGSYVLQLSSQISNSLLSLNEWQTITVSSSYTSDLVLSMPYWPFTLRPLCHPFMSPPYYMVYIIIYATWLISPSLSFMWHHLCQTICHMTYVTFVVSCLMSSKSHDMYHSHHTTLNVGWLTMALTSPLHSYIVPCIVPLHNPYATLHHTLCGLTSSLLYPVLPGNPHVASLHYPM